MVLESDLVRARAAIVEAARRLLAGEISVIEAARVISYQRLTVDPEMGDGELLGFVAIDSQSDHLAVGAMLEEWHPSLREAKRQEVRDFEAFYREGALEDAAVLIQRYEQPA